MEMAVCLIVLKADEVASRVFVVLLTDITCIYECLTVSVSFETVRSMLGYRNLQLKELGLSFKIGINGG